MDMDAARPSSGRPLIDSFGRRITYVRLSVTDRCDLRCRYCMPEAMTFLPRKDLLTLHELELLCDLLIDRGVTRIRLTGGEPLVRKGVGTLVEAVGRRIGRGLEELTLTTNGTQLPQFAGLLHAAGMRRVNVSLDSLDADRFRFITRSGNLGAVLDGIAAAREAGLRVKINMVALKGLNEHEISSMLRWCVDQGFDLSLIETMPLGRIDEDRADRYVPLTSVKARLEKEFALVPMSERTGGPARYYKVGGNDTRLGLITPLTQNFCDGCNRIRVSATGTVYGCLGHDQRVELRDLLRNGGRESVGRAFDALVAGKPRRHDFRIAPAALPSVSRHMSVTGG